MTVFGYTTAIYIAALLPYITVLWTGVNSPPMAQCQLGLNHCSTRQKWTSRGRAGGKDKWYPIQPWITARQTHSNLHHRSQTGINNNNLVPIEKSTNKSTTNFMLLNARSVRNKAVTISEHIQDQKASVSILTETWLQPGEDDIINDSSWI